MTKNKFTDIFFKHLFRIVALFSVLALGAILLFVFIQGTLPFFTPTAQGVQLVPRHIDNITVNGQQYLNQSSIDIPKGTNVITVSFPTNDGEESLRIVLNTSEKDPGKALTFTYNGATLANTGTASTETAAIGSWDSPGGEVKLTYPRAYTYTVSWPSIVAAMGKQVHVILPEPPYNVFKFLGGLKWDPVYMKIYGIFPMIVGTLLASLGAILIGVPIAILCALFMAEFLKPKPASVIRSGVELLAGIPSVVYGFFGVMVIVPAVRVIFHISSGNTLLSAVIVLGIMILPTVITIAETSIRAVPSSVREASLALGASKMQTSWKVVLPHAGSGVVAGIILGISRAVGETMAVILVAGNSSQLIHSPLESVRTLTSTIAMEMGYSAGRHSEMLFSIGVVLFSIILILNSMILWFRRRMEMEQP